MSEFVTRERVYGFSALIASIVIVIVAFTKTNFVFSNDTVTYLFFNPFWAVVIVLFDKFFHEKLQSESDRLKSKIDKVKGMLVTDESSISTESLRLVLNGKDDEISAMKAASTMSKMVTAQDPVSKPGKVNLTLN